MGRRRGGVHDEQGRGDNRDGRHDTWRGQGRGDRGGRVETVLLERVAETGRTTWLRLARPWCYAGRQS